MGRATSQQVTTYLHNLEPQSGDAMLTKAFWHVLNLGPTDPGRLITPPPPGSHDMLAPLTPIPNDAISRGRGLGGGGGLSLHFSLAQHLAGLHPPSAGRPEHMFNPLPAF